jgi:hypothetical protein
MIGRMIAPAAQMILPEADDVQKYMSFYDR